MLVIAVATLLSSGAQVGSADVDLLARLWPGVRDSSEQVFTGAKSSPYDWDESAERRVRTVVGAVDAPWLGPHVLYLEEFLHDDPETVRRQLLLQLEPAPAPLVGVRVHVFAFKEPQRWVHLERRPGRSAQLRHKDIDSVPGCDLALKREGDQFTGGTLGRRCSDMRQNPARYVDYQIVISSELYWYRRRVLLKAGDELVEEVSGFNWIELNEARLFTCRVDWSASGKLSDLRPLVKLELHDEGGQGRFVTPDGRKLQLALHSQDWPYMADRDSLILLLQEQGVSSPLASAWSSIDSDQISIDLGWLRIRCGSLLPDAEALWSDAGPENALAPRA